MDTFSNEFSRLAAQQFVDGKKHGPFESCELCQYWRPIREQIAGLTEEWVWTLAPAVIQACNEHGPPYGCGDAFFVMWVLVFWMEKQGAIPRSKPPKWCPGCGSETDPEFCCYDLRSK